MITENDWDDALSGDLIRVRQAIQLFGAEGQIHELLAYQNLHPMYSKDSLEQALLHIGANHHGSIDTAHFPSAMLRLKHLVALDISLTEAETMPDFASYLPQLEYLFIGTSPLLADLQLNWSKLPDLVSLSIRSTKLKSLPLGFKSCTRLKDLAVLFTDIRSLPNGISHVHRLNFCGNRSLTDFPSDSEPFRQCETIILTDTAIAQLPDDPDLFPVLRELNLSKTPVQTLPASVANWGNGLTIDLRNSQLSSLPESLLSAKSIACIKIQGTPLAKSLRRDFPQNEASRLITNKDRLRCYQLSKCFKLEIDPVQFSLDD
jgi:Leucine-rich repeat (LRR) protein